MTGRPKTGRRDPAPRAARPGPAHRAAKPPAEAPSPEAVIRRAARLDEAVRLCGPADLDALLRLVPVKARQLVVRGLGVQADPRYIPGGVGRLVVGAVHALGPGRRGECLAQLCSGLALRGHQVLGADRFADPSAEDLALLLDTLLEEVPAGAVRLLFAQQVVQGCRAADLIEALGDDPRLAPEPEPAPRTRRQAPAKPPATSGRPPTARPRPTPAPAPPRARPSPTPTPGCSPPSTTSSPARSSTPSPRSRRRRPPRSSATSSTSSST